MIPMVIFGVGLVGCATTADVPGHISRRVTLSGKPPAERPLPLDPHCAIAWRKAHGDARPTTKFYAVGDTGALADVVVWLEGGEGKLPLPTSVI